MAYLKENSTIKDKFFKKILTQKSEKHFLAPNGGGGGGKGVDLYTVSTYTRVDTVHYYYYLSFIFVKNKR